MLESELWNYRFSVEPKFHAITVRVYKSLCDMAVKIYSEIPISSLEDVFKPSEVRET